MMHEQHHSETTATLPVQNDPAGGSSTNLPGDGRGQRKLSLDEQIKPIGAKLRDRAAKHCYLTHEENNAAIVKGEFSQLLRLNNTTALHVILTVSPADIEGDDPFWHCSISIVSTGRGKAKTVNLWTKKESKIVRVILPMMFGDAGRSDSQGFLRTKTAPHCYRGLTAQELGALEVVSEISG